MPTATGDGYVIVVFAENGAKREPFNSVLLPLMKGRIEITKSLDSESMI